MKFPKYRKYKDSGAEWIGRVPAHWKADRLKWSVSSCKNGIWGDEPKGDDNDVRCVRVADFDRKKLVVNRDIPTFRNLSAAEQDKYLLQPGDLLLEKSGGGDKQPVGCAVLSKHSVPAVYANFIARIRPAEGMCPSFWRFVHAAGYDIGLNIPSIKQTSGIQNLDQQSYLDELGPFPPYDEQKQIAAFLDHETAKIDALIEEQQRLIELLKEKRQAVISHAVTKGLDPDARMKDSSVEWLGKVPEHWDVVRIGSLYREAVEPGDAELPVLRVSIHHGVSDRELSEEESDRKITRIQDRAKYKRVRPGDLTYNMMRAWQGAFGAVSVDGLVSPAYVVARTESASLSPFLERQLRTPNGVEEMRRNSYGITDFRLRLYWDQWKDIYVVVPPEKERLAICDFASNEESRTNSLIEESEHVIYLLKERRSATGNPNPTPRNNSPWLPKNKRRTKPNARNPALQQESYYGNPRLPDHHAPPSRTPV